MSLVAYAASSGEESECEEEEEGTKVQLLKPLENGAGINNRNNEGNHPTTTNGHISDEDDDFIPQEVCLQELKAPSARLLLSLPKPKVAVPDKEQKESLPAEQVTQAFAKLPMPRGSAKSGGAFIEEADDEFLHKKALPAAVDVEKPPPAAAAKTRVKISIPSLRDFADVDKEKAEMGQKSNNQNQVQPKKGCGLLSLLPQAKSERVFTKQSEPVAAGGSSTAKITTSVRPAFIPDTVKLRRAAHNTEGIEGVKAPSSKQKQSTQIKPTAALVNASDSEEGDDDEDQSVAGDFFSLHSEQELPEVSSNEISALVAKRAAKMLEASNKYLKEQTEKEQAAEEVAEMQSEELRLAQKRYHEQKLNTEAMDALVGKNAKRRRKEEKGMQVIDISGTEVLPDRGEWMRSALASATTFQPTGVLTDEEPVAGTRRKHQITYLAHKAKANEAELQAMWSANRQSRRATQSKYGF